MTVSISSLPLSHDSPIVPASVPSASSGANNTLPLSSSTTYRLGFSTSSLDTKETNSANANAIAIASASYSASASALGFGNGTSNGHPRVKTGRYSNSKTMMSYYASPVEGSSPRWYLPGRAHVPQPYENHISHGLSDFIQNKSKRTQGGGLVNGKASGGRVKGAAGFGGSRKHFPVIETPTQREPQLSTAKNVDYYKRETYRNNNGTSGSGGGSGGGGGGGGVGVGSTGPGLQLGYRRHLGYVTPPKPVERVQRLRHIMPYGSNDSISPFGMSTIDNGSMESSAVALDSTNDNHNHQESTSTSSHAVKSKKQVRFVGEGNGSANGNHHVGLRKSVGSSHGSSSWSSASPSYPEPNLPRLGRHAMKNMLRNGSRFKEEQSLAVSLGRRVKVNTKEFKHSDRAGAQRILRGTPSRVQEEVSLSGESFFGRKVDLITFKRFVSNLGPAPRVPLLESLKRTSTRQRRQVTNSEIRTVQDLDNWKPSFAT